MLRFLRCALRRTRQRFRPAHEAARDRVGFRLRRAADASAALCTQGIEAVANFAHRLLQFRNSLAGPGGGRHHRYTQGALQKAGIDRQTRPRRLIHQIDAEHDSRRQLQNLQRQTERPFQAGRIADHHRAVRTAFAQKLLRHCLLLRAADQRVCTGQIGQPVGLSFIFIASLRQLHRLAGPVPGVLIQAGQGVKQRTFPNIWISGKRNKPHVSSTSTQMRALSSRRSATIVPRKL